MIVGAKVNGGADMSKRLLSLPSAVTAPHQRTALMRGAELVRAEAEIHAPRGPHGGEHLADHIVIDAVTDAELDRSVDFVGAHAVVMVGPDRKRFWGYFLEYGTVKMRAQPFMRPAVEIKGQPALTVALSHLWELILAVTGGRTAGSVGQQGGRNL